MSIENVRSNGGADTVLDRHLVLVEMMLEL